jgi:hypothetical protein
MNDEIVIGSYFLYGNKDIFLILIQYFLFMLHLFIVEHFLLFVL